MMVHQEIQSRKRKTLIEKRKYEQPTIEIVELDVEDIMTTSGKGAGWFGDNSADGQIGFGDLTSGNQYYT